jgi:exopolysaccharide biosynthesis predicted pyruvyltransferase EpsI
MIQQVTDAPPAAPEITFIGAPGNAGDAVITLATLPWIHSLQLEEDTIVFKGGGLGHHGNLHELLDSLPRDRRLIVAPTSLDAAAADILTTFPRAHVFCRGAVSLALAKARGLSCELAHDLALATDCTRWRDLPAAGTLNCFRGDVESATNHRPTDNDDVSLAAHRTWTPDNCTETAHAFIRTIAGYRTVHTDRLHVGIIAGLLGRETHLYASRDHKITEVHAHSLRHLGNVTLHRAEETHVGPVPRAVIIHQSSREDRKASVLELFRKVGNCSILEAVAPLWESAPSSTLRITVASTSAPIRVNLLPVI